MKTPDYSNHWYFAHNKIIYDTPLECNMHQFLLTILRNVVCPNKDMGELGDIKSYLERVKLCYGVVVAECRGSLGKGAYEEVKCALDLHKPVIALRHNSNNRMLLIGVDSVEIVDSKSWKYGYGKIITR
jgi:hypothetical protein